MRCDELKSSWRADPGLNSAALARVYYERVVDVLRSHSAIALRDRTLGRTDFGQRLCELSDGFAQRPQEVSVF